MAQLPSLKRIQREDVGEAPTWINRIIVPVNNFFQVVYSQLAKNITFQDNIKSEIYNIAVDGSDTTASIELPQNLTNPVGVLLISIDTPPLSGVTISWQQVGTQLQILDITGLDVSTTYNLRILVF